jgi:hypothetical protein
MTSLLSSIADNAAPVSGGDTSGADARLQFDSKNTLSQGELNQVAGGTVYSGGRRRRRRSAKKTSRRRKSSSLKTRVKRRRSSTRSWFSM